MTTQNQVGFSQLTSTTFDLLVIGGGILGAGIARDAALRGLRVALVEQADFASGTSSRSSKLIHGGLRYLEHGQLALVAESCRERDLLRQLAPHLIHPQPFLFPVYAADPRPLWKIRLGLSLYDFIARTHHHRSLSTAETLALEPALHPAGLRGSVLYYDCREDDAQFCRETILHAADLGAVCVEHCEIASVDHDLARTTTGHEIRARFFINATGPWLERLAGPGLLSPTKGVHLLLPALTRQHAITFQAARDHRILFVIPWKNQSLVGTTDTDWQGNPATVQATPADIDYLLTEVRRLFPNSGPILDTVAGVRPLLRSGHNPSARTREHRILRHRENFFSVAGGKYTTFRLIAKEAVDLITDKPCRTHLTPWPVRT